MQGKVEICGVNTAKLKTLSPDQMDELLRKANAGDETARQALIEGNLRLVLSVIQRFEKRGESPDDLFQVGCIGLIKAISNFDPTKNVRFSTYGVPMIAGEVRRYLRDNSAIRVSRSIRDVAYKVLQCKENLLLQLGREPTIEEIAKELGLPMEDISEALAMERYLLSRGIPEESILREELAASTHENFANSKVILDGIFEEGYSVAVISNDFHLPRAALTAKRAGLDGVSRLHASTPFYMILPNAIREYMATAKYLLFS